MADFVFWLEAAVSDWLTSRPALRSQPFFRYLTQLLSLLALYYRVEQFSKVVKPEIKIDIATAEPDRLVVQELLDNQRQFWDQVESEETKQKAQKVVEQAVDNYRKQNPEVKQVIQVESKELPIDPKRQTGASQLLGGGFSVGIKKD